MKPTKKVTFHHLFQALRETADPCKREPLPERWIELLRYLNAKEREERASHADRRAVQGKI